MEIRFFIRYIPTRPFFEERVMSEIPQTAEYRNYAMGMGLDPRLEEGVYKMVGR